MPSLSINYNIPMVSGCERWSVYLGTSLGSGSTFTVYSSGFRFQVLSRALAFASK